MVEAGLKCSVNACIEARDSFFKKMPKSDVFQHIVDHFGIKKGGKTPNDVAMIGKTTFHSREVEKGIRLFPEVRQVLADLKARYLTFLVTSGDPETQKQKVEILRIKDFFTHIYYVNNLLKQRKSAAFFEIMNHIFEEPRQILCVGDRRDREIAEGKRIGFTTCLLRRDYQMCIRPNLPEENPDFEIDHLSELIKACRL